MQHNKQLHTHIHVYTHIRTAHIHTLTKHTLYNLSVVHFDGFHEVQCGHMHVPYCTRACTVILLMKQTDLKAFPKRLTQVLSDLVHSDTAHGANSQCSNERITVLTILNMY